MAYSTLPLLSMGWGSPPTPAHFPEHYLILLLPTPLPAKAPPLQLQKEVTLPASGSGLGIHASWLPPSPTQGRAGLQHVCVWVKRSTFELWLQERTACTATPSLPATKNVQQRMISPHLQNNFFFKRCSVDSLYVVEGG